MGVNITTIAHIRVLIIELGTNLYFNGGGSPGRYHYMDCLGMKDFSSDPPVSETIIYGLSNDSKDFCY